MSTTNETGSEAKLLKSSTFPAPLECDYAEYVGDLDGMDMNDAQKIELLQILWDMMRSFVELGIDIQTADLCEQIFNSDKLVTPPSLPGVKSSFTTAIGTTDIAPGKDCE